MFSFVVLPFSAAPAPFHTPFPLQLLFDLLKRGFMSHAAVYAIAEHAPLTELPFYSCRKVKQTVQKAKNSIKSIGQTIIHIWRFIRHTNTSHHAKMIWFWFGKCYFLVGGLYKVFIEI